MNSDQWREHERKRIERQRAEIAKRVAKFDKFDTETLHKVKPVSPWERAALKYVLAGR